MIPRAPRAWISPSAPYRVRSIAASDASGLTILSCVSAVAGSAITPWETGLTHWVRVRTAPDPDIAPPTGPSVPSATTEVSCPVSTVRFVSVAEPPSGVTVVALSTITVAPEVAGTHTTFVERTASTVVTLGSSAGVRVVIPTTTPVRTAKPNSVSNTRRIFSPPVRAGPPRSLRSWGPPGR